MAFQDKEFVFPVLPKETLNVTFSTKISETQTGGETRIPQKVEALFSYSFEKLTLKKQEVSQVRDFYRSVSGVVDTFKYKSLVENKTTYLIDQYDEEEELVIIGSYGKMFYNATLDAWQAVKVWEIKDKSALIGLESRKTYKTLRHPVIDTVRIFISGIETFDFNHLGFGVFEIDGTNPNSDITFECEFLTEVRFKSSSINIAQISQDNYEISGIEFTEEVNNSIGGYFTNDFTNCHWIMNLPFVPTSESRGKLETRIETLDNFRESRFLTSNSLKNEVNLEANVITELEKNKLLTWFMVAKGRCLDFIYNQFLTRFESDTLSVSLLVQDGCKYFEYTQIPLRQYQEFFDDNSYTAVAYMSSPSSFEDNQSLLCYESMIEYINTQSCSDIEMEFLPPIYPTDGRYLRWCADRGGVPSNKKALIFIFCSYSPDYHNDDLTDYSATPEYIEDLEYFLQNANPLDRYVIIQHETIPEGSTLISYESKMNFKFPRHYKLSMLGGGGYQPNPRSGQFTFAGYQDFYFDSAEELFRGFAGYHASFQEVKPLAFCLKITKGTTVKGFTSLDMDFVVEGTLFKSRSAIEPSATDTELNLSTDNLEIKALINNEDITDKQLISGFWDNALVQLFLFNFVDPPPTFAEGIPLIQGRVGRVTLTNNTYTFELRSLTEILNRPVARKTSPKCHYSFGDSKCGLNLIAANLRYLNVAVTNVIGSNVIEVDTSGIGDDFIYGTIEVKSGGNVGILLEISAVDEGLQQIQFNGELAEDFQIGDILDITAFCKKDQYACKAYNNFERFGGIPVGGNFVPGLDRITVAY